MATGFRYTVIATSTPGRQLQWLDARHRVHAHVESGIRRSKALTLTRLPSAKFALNQAWCTLLALTMDLISWLRLLALDGKPARAEPATLRSELFDIPAKLADHARGRELKFDPAWPAAHRAVAVPCVCAADRHGYSILPGGSGHLWLRVKSYEEPHPMTTTQST